MSRTQNRFGDRLLMALVFLFLYAPIIILIVFSFNAGNSSSVWKGFSLHWYAELLNDRLIMQGDGTRGTCKKDKAHCKSTKQAVFCLAKQKVPRYMSKKARYKRFFHN